MFFNVPCSATGTIITPIEAKAITHIFFQPKNERLWRASIDDSGAVVSIMIDGKQICRDLFVLPFCTQTPTPTCNFDWRQVAIEVNINVALAEIKISRADNADYDTDDYDIVFVCSTKEVDESKGFEYFETKSLTVCKDSGGEFAAVIGAAYEQAVLDLKISRAAQLNKDNDDLNKQNAKKNAERSAEIEKVKERNDLTQKTNEANKALNQKNTLLNERNKRINEANADTNQGIRAHNTARGEMRQAVGQLPSLNAAKTAHDTALQAQTDAQTAVDNAQTAHTAALQAQTNAQTAVDNAQTAHDTALQAQTNAQTAADEAQAAHTAALQAQTNAQTAADEAQTAHTAALQAQTNAQTAVDNAQAALDNATDDDKAALQDALAKAQEELTTATAEAEAKAKELETAQEELTTATAEAEAKAKELETAQEELTTATAEAEAKAKELETAQEEQTTATAEAEAKAKELETAQEELTTATAEAEARAEDLDDELQKFEDRRMGVRAAYTALNTAYATLNKQNAERNKANVEWNTANVNDLAAYEVDPLPTDNKTDYRTDYHVNYEDDEWPDEVEADEPELPTDAKTDYPTDAKTDVPIEPVPEDLNLPTDYKTDYQATDSAVMDALVKECGVKKPGPNDEWTLQVTVNITYNGENMTYNVDDRSGYYLNGGPMGYVQFLSTFWQKNLRKYTKAASFISADYSFDVAPTCMFAYCAMQITPATTNDRDGVRATTPYLRDNFTQMTIRMSGAEGEIIPDDACLSLISATNHVPMREALYQIGPDAGMRKSVKVSLNLPVVTLRGDRVPTRNLEDPRGQIPTADPRFWRVYFFFGYRKLA